MHVRQHSWLRGGAALLGYTPMPVMISPPTAVNRSKTRAAVRCERATTAAQVAGRPMEIAIASMCKFRRKGNAVGCSGLRAAQDAARVLRRRQPMLNRNSRAFHFHFPSAGDAFALWIPAVEVATHVGVRARRRATASALNSIGHLEPSIRRLGLSIGCREFDRLG